MTEHVIENNGSDAWKDWPKASAVADELEISVRQLKRHVERNEVPRYQAPDGTYRYKPEEVAMFKAFLEGEETEAEVVTSKKGGADQHVAVELVKVFRELLQQELGNNRELMKLVLNPNNALLSMLKDENAALRQRCSTLEDKHTDLVMAREEMLSQVHERGLATKTVEAQEKRKTQAFGMLMQSMPTLAKQMGIDPSKLAQGLSNEDQGKVNAAVELLTSIDPEMLEALGASGMLNDEQMILLRKIVPEEKTTEEPTKEENNGTS